jgi:hypothetical protein
MRKVSQAGNHEETDEMTTNLSMYAPIEQAILAEYFGLSTPNLDDDLDWWATDPKYPSSIKLEPDAWDGRDQDKAIANAVARIALARVQKSLPQFAICGPDSIEFGRDIATAPSRPVEMMSRHLFTIDWAMTAPGVSWPEAYYLTWLPGIDQWLVTSSRDTPEVGGYCDLALGQFSPDKSPLEGAGLIIGGNWCDQYIDYDQPHWELFFEAGLVTREVANEWADEVWNASEQDEYDEDGPEAVEGI